MPPWHARRYVLSEIICGIDVERGAAGELNGIFGLKLVELLEKRLPEIGDGHLPFNSDFHVNSLKYISEMHLIPILYNLWCSRSKFRGQRISHMQQYLESEQLGDPGLIRNLR